MNTILDTQWLLPGGDAVGILLDSGVKCIAVLAAAGVALARMRQRSATARHLVCFLSLASLPLLPVLSWTLPGWRVLPGWMDFHQAKVVVVTGSAKAHSPAEGSVGTATTRPWMGVEVANPELVSPAQVTSPRIQMAVPVKRSSDHVELNWWRAGFIVWLAGLLLALMPPVLGVISLHRLERASRRETGAPWLDLVGQLCLRLRVTRPVVLLKTARRRMPMTWGAWLPKIMLPEESGQWSHERRSVVLLHELAHAKRFDYLTHLIARLVCAIYWFNPLVWLAARRMVIERERACDDIVLRHGADPADYAQQVLEISAKLSTSYIADCSAVAMARTSNLEGRLRAILDAKRNRAALTRGAVIVALLVLTIILVPVAMMKAAPAIVIPAAGTAEEIEPLERKVSLSAHQMPLKDALAQICQAAHVELDLDVEGLESAELKADFPITLRCKDEQLKAVLQRIWFAIQRQWQYQDVYWKLRGQKLLVRSQHAEQARMLRILPDWLKPLYNNGLVANVDDEGNVISIYVGGKADDKFLAKLKTLPKLRELDITATATITPAGLAHLTELPTLEKLNLYGINPEGNGLGADALRFVAKIQTLRDLSIGECSVTDDGARALEGMTQLTALSLHGNKLTDVGMKSLAGLTNLHSLDISGSPWVHSHMQIADEGMNHLSRLTKLRGLSVGLLQISGRTISFPHLQSLSLGGNLVTDAALDSLVQCRELRQLALSYTEVSDEGLRRVASLKELRSLNLDSRRITDAGIAHLTSLPKLESITLRATRVNDESLRHLSQINSLTRIDLHGSGVPGVNYGTLFTIQGLQQLKTLPQLRDLTINNFESTSGFLGLREISGLRSLVLSHTNIKDEEAELLEAVMPDTRVLALRNYMSRLQAQGPLPSATLFLSGRAVDDITGNPVSNSVLEFGVDDPGKPGEVTWGEATSRPQMEVSVNDPHEPGRFLGGTYRTGKIRARLLAKGYQPTPLKLNSPTLPLRLTNLVVRMHRRE